MSPTPDPPIAATLVTGFLGSGKTTLINAVLHSPGFANTLVIVNEFGEIGLDHLLIEGSQDQVILMDAGCLCCQINGSLRDTLIDVFMRRSAASIPSFDRVIIETSGLANPMPLLSILIADSAVSKHFRLDLVLTLVDSVNGLHVLSTYDEAVRQVAVADRVVVSKVDLGDPHAVAALGQRLAEINQTAQRTEWQQGQDPRDPFVPISAATHTYIEPEARPDTEISPSTPHQRTAGLNHGPLFGNIRGYAFRFEDMIDWPAYAAWTAWMTRTFRHKLLRCKGILSIGRPGELWVIQAVQGHFVAPVRFRPALQGASESTQSSLPVGQAPKPFLQCICDQVSRDELIESFPLFEHTAAPSTKES